MIDRIPYGMTAGLPASLYHLPQLGVASKSALDQLDKSPAHYRAWLAGECEQHSKALEFGSALHCRIMEPDRFASGYAVRPDFGDGRTKAAKEAKALWESSTVGKTAVSPDDSETIAHMAARIEAHPVAGRLFRGGMAESTIAWMDPDSGVDCKGRVDYYRGGVAIDLKTTTDASPSEFAKSIAGYRYHVQAALYLQGLQACGEKPKGFIFVAVEKEPPYAVGVYELHPEDIGKGYLAVARGLSTMAQCLRTDHWPAYSDHIELLRLPAWAA